MSRKFIVTGLTSAAIVATMGLAFAQSQDESALGNANINGTQNSLGHDLAGPPAMPAQAAAMSAAETLDAHAALPAPAAEDATLHAPPAAATDLGTAGTAAPDAAPMGSTTGMPASRSDANASAGNTPWTAPAGTTPPQGTTTPAGSSPQPDSGAAGAAAVPGGTSAATGTVPDSADGTRIDLNSPDEPLYNLQGDPMGNNFREGSDGASTRTGASPRDSDNASGSPGIRAPRADRN